MSVVLIVAYCVLLIVLSVYGVHRLWMVWTFLTCWHRMLGQSPAERYTSLPRVTIQLPMFNEPNVAERVIQAACRVDYPADHLQVQVLDDSTDDCAQIAERCCRQLADEGVDVVYIHRENREGFKAGALANGLETATGEFIAVFDADFIPPESFLRDTIDYFTEERIGMVQTRWEHLNRDQSLLTQVQAMFLDGHFVVEQTARAASDRWFNFNGTAGIWRRECIEDAGGWQHDTLTEDTDLSYRAQLRGWAFRYLPAVECPAEIPPTLSGFLSQQHRWNKGLVETGMKLLPRLLHDTVPAKRGIESWFHLTSPMLYLVVLMISLLLPASMLWASADSSSEMQQLSQFVLWSGLACLLLGTGAAAIFYVASQWMRGRSRLRSVLLVPLLLAVGVGISVVNSAAVISALAGRKSPFIRTPKFAGGSIGAQDPVTAGLRRAHAAGSVELLLAILIVLCLVLSYSTTMLVIGMPFTLLFIAGFAWIGIGRICSTLRTARVPA